MEDIKLTKLANCAGCGAKVGAGELAKLLKDINVHSDPNLLVGFDKSDDASVYKISDELALVQTLENVQTVTGTLKGPQGALGVLMGNEADARQVVTTIERANALLSRADALTARLDSLVANADRQVFGQGASEGQGALVPDLRAAVQQVNGLLGEARGTLKKVDAVLVEAQGLAANTRTATVDLDVLRAEVEASLRKVDTLINDINRRWPFSSPSEIELK